MPNFKKSIPLFIIYWFITLLLVRIIYNFWELTYYSFVAQFIQDNFVIAQRILLTNVFGLGVMILAFITLLLFRRFIKKIQPGQPFSTRTLKLLRKSSFAFILLAVFSILQKIIFEYFVAIPFKIEMSDQAGVFNYWLLFFAVFMWGLTHVFSNGLNLQQEKDLTI